MRMFYIGFKICYIKIDMFIFKVFVFCDIRELMFLLILIS